MDDTTRWIETIENDSFRAPISSEDAAIFLENSIQLFRQPYALNNISTNAGETVLNRIATWLGVLLFDENVSLELRIETISSSIALFETWYANKTEYSYSCDFFWDAILHSHKRKKRRVEDIQQIRDAIFQSLNRIITISNKNCQRSALHAFNHLADDRCQSVIERFIKSSKDQDLISYAKVVRTYSAL